VTSQQSTIPMLQCKLSNFEKSTDEDFSRYLNKIESMVLRKA